MLHKRILIGLILTLFLSVSCKQKEPVLEKTNRPVISFAFSWGYGFKKTVLEFKEQVSDDFEINIQENMGLNHKQKILIDVSSHTIPDVFCFWSYETNLKPLAETGILLDIDEFFKETEFIARSDFYDDSLKSTEINGINYAIPLERFYGFFAVNKEIFKRYNLDYPEYWSDFQNLSTVLNAEGIIPLSMGSYRGDPGHLLFSALALQHPEGKKDIQNMKNSNNFIFPGNRAAADTVNDLIALDAIPKNTIYEGSFDRQVDLYNQELAASIFAFSWSLALFDENIAENTEIIPVPKINKNSIDTDSFTIGGTAQSICISREAWNNPIKRPHIIRLVNWLFSEEVFYTKVIQSGCVPTRDMNLKKIDHSIYKKAEKYIQDKELYGIHEFYFPTLSIFNKFKEANDLLWGGALNTDDFLEMVQNSMAVINE